MDSICTTINGLWKGEKGPLVNIGVIRNANFTKEFTLDYSKIEYIDVELRSFERRYLDDGDIIVEKSGGSDNFPVGRSILFCGESRKYSFSNFTMSLRIIDKRSVLPKYLYYVLQQKYRRGDMRQMQTQTTGLHNLLSDVFLSMPIPIPPKEEQQRIVERVDNIFKIVSELDVLRHESTHLIDAAKSRILDLAIHGKLVPQDSSDEPAIEILKRINPAFTPSDNLHYEDGIPDGWLLCTLGDVSDYGQCKSVPVDEIDDDAWVLELEDIEKDTGKVLQRLVKKERNSCGTRHQFKTGQVLYSKLRTYLNKVFVTDEDGFCTTEIIPITPIDGVDPVYLSLVLRSQYFLDYSAQCGYGVKMPRMGTQDARKAVVPIPPTKEQIRIVDKTKRILAELETIASLNAF